MENRILNLRWRQHGLELTTLLDDVRKKGLYSDATILCGNREYHIHSAILSISSDFFHQIFKETKERCCEVPFIVINDVSPLLMQQLLIYIYCGEISVHQDEVSNFFELARSLQIKGPSLVYGDNNATSLAATNSPEARMIANNQVIEQLKNPEKTSNFIRKDDSTPRKCNKSISIYNNNISTEIKSENLSVISKDSVDQKISPIKTLPPRCPATPSFPMDLTTNTTASSGSTFPQPVPPPSLLSSSSTSSSKQSTSKSSHSVILPFEALIKEEPDDSQEIYGSKDVDKNSTPICTGTEHQTRTYEAVVCNSEKKVLRAIPPMIPLTNSNKETSYRQEDFSNKILPTNYTLGIPAFSNRDLNQPVSNCPSADNFTSPVPSRTFSNVDLNQPVSICPADNFTSPVPSQTIDPTSPSNLITLSNVDIRLCANSRPNNVNYLKKDNTNSSSDGSQFKVHSYGEVSMGQSSHSSYSIPHRQDDDNNQPQQKSTIIREDLESKIQGNLMEKSREVNPVTTRDTPIAHRNPRLLVNALPPVVPSRYNSRFLGSNKKTPTQVPSSLTHINRNSISNINIPESQKGSINTISLGTAQSLAYRSVLPSPSSQIGVRKDLKVPSLNPNTLSVDQSHDNSNDSAISSMGRVSLSPKDSFSKNLSNSVSNIMPEAGTSFSDARLNITSNFNSAYSNEYISYHTSSSLPSANRDELEKSEETIPDITTLATKRPFSENEESDDGHFHIQRIKSISHPTRSRGPKAWEFLARLLKDPSTNGKLIRWEEENKLTFRLLKPDEIARRWGSRQVKSSKCSNYNNFARSLRYHYRTGALAAQSERQLVYKFGPKAISVLEEYDNIFSKATITSSIGLNLLRIEREYYDTNPELTGKTCSLESNSDENSSLQFQKQTETNSLNTTDSNVCINSHPRFIPLNYGITYQTPSGNIVPVPNIPDIPFPMATSSQNGPVCVSNTTATTSMNVPHLPNSITTNFERTSKPSVSTRWNGSVCISNITTTSNMNIPHHPKSITGNFESISNPSVSTRPLPSFSNIKSAVTNATLSTYPLFKPRSAIKVTNESNKTSSTSKIIFHNEMRENQSTAVGKELMLLESAIKKNNNEHEDNKNPVNNSDIKSIDYYKRDSNNYNVSKPLPNLSSKPESSLDSNMVSNCTNLTTLEPVKSLVTSTSVSQITTALPKFSPEIKSHSNLMSIPPSSHPTGDMNEIINTVSEIKSTTSASTDNPNKEANNISPGSDAKSIIVGQKHKLEEKDKHGDLKRRFKTDNKA